MKIRKGFVSNSSSSSYICDFCGDVASGYDCSLQEFDMSECEHGHIFCNGHVTQYVTDAPLEEKKEIVNTYLNKDNKYYEQYKQKEQDKHDKKVELNSYEESESMLNPNYFLEKVKFAEDRILRNNEQLKSLEKCNEEQFDEEFSELLEEIINDIGVPEKYCPVCQRLEEMKRQPEYEQYKALYERFNQVKPDGTF